MKVIYLILLFVCLAAGLQEQKIKSEWLKFIAKYNKIYPRSLVEQTRYAKFKKNLEIIKKHNKKYENGDASYEMGINYFSDMNSKEMESILMDAQIIKRYQEKFLNSTLFKASATLRNNYPISWDWREKGAISPVKNQKRCGSCWAFSSTGALEAHFFIKNNQSIVLSEQNLVDCVKENWGCRGGWMHTAFNYVHKNGGINTDNDYPYEAVQGNCRYHQEHIEGTCSGYVSIRPGDEQQLLQAVATRGPVSVAFYTLPSFYNYKSGIYDESRCQSNLLHAVLVVGYGSENGHDYWLVKNSWDTNWGENGYIKMSRNKNNQCGIASWALYPLV